MSHILLVEDDSYFIEFLESMLSRDGHQVSMVGDGVQALLWLAEHRADLIITDLLMPNMDGRALMRELARQKIDTPVIAMSGGQRANPQAFNEELAQQLGFRTFLKKPFTRVALRRAVELALGKKLCPQQST